MITNLENQAGLVERVHTSLAGEVKRRQQVLKDAGNVADIGHYAALRAERRPDLEPLPHLFVVIDEFGELLTAKPDFIDLFLSIGRIGRSIGVHLLLSSQRIEGGKLKGLDTYLSYRLGLRTFSPDESRTVLDTTDAFHLPPLPGFGYLKVDTSAYTRFKAGYVSGRYRGALLDKTEEEGPLALAYPTYNTLADSAGGAEEPGAEDSRPAATVRETGPTVLSVMVDQLKGAAPPARRIWLPPLPDALSLDTAAGPLGADEHGMRLGDRRGAPMKVPLGVLDAPARQWRGPWELDLTVAGGHTAVIGGPQSGKTTLLRTLALSLALTHTPATSRSTDWTWPVAGSPRSPGCRMSAGSPVAPTRSGWPARSRRYGTCSPPGSSSSASTASTPSTSSGGCAPRAGSVSSPRPTWCS